jgi:hypothetical protein
VNSSKWICIAVFGTVLGTANFAVAQDHGNGHGKGHEKHEDEDDEHDSYYKHHDRDAIRGWYSENETHLPPGLAKRDQLPPGLEKQLVRRGTLPPGLQKRIQPCPEELERRLPPPPPDCRHVVIGGHVALINVHTFFVVDLFHLEIQ